MFEIYIDCRRDSFITHRAFCDALAQESAREPPTLSSAIGNQLFGNSNNMSLGLSQNLGSQIPSIHDQNSQPSDLLRFCGAPRTGPFDHILPPNMASPFRPSSHQTMQLQNPPFFMPESNQNYHDHQQGLISNKPFQGMIQLSDLNNSNTPSASNLFNLPFLSNRGHTPNYSEEHHFNPTEGSNFFTEGTIIGTDHQTSSATAPSVFSTSLQNTTNMSHMSATALLQKAAQMGAASSSTNNSASSLLRSLASKSDHRPLLSAANYSNILNSSVQEMMNLPGFEAYDHGITNKEPKLSVGGSDRLTRDFLGVAQQQQQQRGFNLSSLEAETNNAAPSGQSFGGGANFQ